MESLGRFRRGLCCWMGSLLCFFLGRELLPYLAGNGICVHFVSAGSILEHTGGVAACRGKQDARLDQQTGKRPFIGAAKKGSEGLCQSSLIALLTDSMLPRQRLQGGHRRHCRQGKAGVRSQGKGKEDTTAIKEDRHESSLDDSIPSRAAKRAALIFCAEKRRQGEHMLFSPCTLIRPTPAIRSPAARQKTFPLLHFPLGPFTANTVSYAVPRSANF